MSSLAYEGDTGGAGTGGYLASLFLAYRLETAQRPEVWDPGVGHDLNTPMRFLAIVDGQQPL